jgi:hypothetical protein
VGGEFWQLLQGGRGGRYATVNVPSAPVGRRQLVDHRMPCVDGVPAATRSPTGVRSLAVARPSGSRAEVISRAGGGSPARPSARCG